MRFLLQLPIVRTLHARGLLLLAVLIPLVGGVLLHGALQPRETAPESGGRPARVPEPAPLLTFRPDLEKTPLTYLSDYWLQLGDAAVDKIVLIGEQRTPAVVVTRGFALTSIVAADDVRRAEERSRTLAAPTAEEEPSEEPQEPDETGDPSAVSEDPAVLEAPGSGGPYRLVGTDPELGLALFALEPPDSAPAFTTTSPTALHSGAFVAAVTRSSSGGLRIAPGYLGAIRSTPVGGEALPSLDVSIPLPVATEAAAIVDLDGNLLGVSLRLRDGVHALTSGHALRIVERLRENPFCHSLEVIALPPAVRELLSIEGGVLLERVRREAFVPEPSILAGDVLLEWGGETVSDVDHFRELYEQEVAGALVRYRVLRDRRRVSGGTVMPDASCRPVGEPPVVFPAVGVRLRWTDPRGEGPEDRALRVVAVDPDGPARRAGLTEDDWLTALDGRPVDQQLVDRLFGGFETRRGAMLVKVWRAGRVRLLALQPAGTP